MCLLCGGDRGNGPILDFDIVCLLSNTVWSSKGIPSYYYHAGKAKCVQALAM